MRIGVLGAARIAPAALIKPAHAVPDVEVAAVAARDRVRAAAFAGEHGIPVVHASYEALLADPMLDAVYVPLPNGRHEQWTIAALRAGKHVLCEKPLTSNAAQALEVRKVADETGLVVMEAFHYRYHPLAARMAEVAHGGELGRISRVETAMCFPLPRFGDIRYDYGLAGGALMDAGCYALHCLRLLSPAPPAVTSAHALPFRRDARIDRAMTADFDLGDGATGRIKASMWSSTVLSLGATVVGERGTLKVFNFVMPRLFAGFRLTRDGKSHREKFGGEPTYTHQLRAFAAAVRGDAAANLTPPADSLATMTLVDDVYRAAGLPIRE
jgi:predicted dehydrogenase